MIDEFGNKFRVQIFTALLSLILLGFTGRLVELQLLSKKEYGSKSEKNSMRQIPREPARGSIFDRNKKLLVDTRPAFSLFITPSDFDERLIPILSRALNMDSLLIEEKLTKGRNYSVFAPVKIKREIDFKTLSFFEENQDKFRGIEILPEPKRTYFSKARMAHFLGYVKEITDEQITKDTGYYKPGDYIGQKGIESSYEEYLRGVKGYNWILVNSHGEKIGKYDEGNFDKPPIDGVNLNLSVDADLQLLAETLLGNRKGAIVALDPNNGEILAMASKPDFDLNDFSGVTPTEIWDNLSSDPDKPFLNRAVLGQYPPGSTFKMVLAATALQEGIIDEKWTTSCNGSFPFGDKTFKCTHVHGTVNVTKALHQSCNIFFYRLMIELYNKKGWSYWCKYANLFGFGKKTGIDINDLPGFIPTEAFYNKKYGKTWGTGYLVSLSIGQGEVTVTPLQMACYCSVIANWGKYWTPHFLHSYYDKQTQIEKLYQTQYHEIPISKEVWEVLRNGMYLAVNGAGGTGLAAKVPGVVVAGKTGTAQNALPKNHAWFIGFAPYDNPKIVVAVLIENGGFGGSASAPIAGELIKEYLTEHETALEESDLKTRAEKILNSSTKVEVQD